MAPEQCRSDVKVTDKSDVYALGTVLFRCLAGRTPFVTEARGDAALMHICAQQIAEPVPSLLQFAPEIPPRLAALVERTLTKAPEGRPTMREFRQALLQIRDDLNQADGLADHPTRALGKALDPTVPMRRDQAPTAIPLPVVRKATGQPSTRWKPIAAGVIALVWLAILAVWALS